MYGFALGGFLMGFGSQLAQGDIIFHLSSQISKGKWFSLLILLLTFSSSLLFSWILSDNRIPFLTNQ